MACARDRITINAGGRQFETTTATLLSSGSGFFQALLGSTGSALSDGNFRNSSTDDEAPSRVRDIFVDRNPELFAIVLDFMRSHRLLAALTRSDAARLQDLLAEADFFAYDALHNACAEALNAWQDQIPTASSSYKRLHADIDEPVWIQVPRGHVLYIVSAIVFIMFNTRDEPAFSLEIGETLQDMHSIVSCHETNETNQRYTQCNLPLCLSSPPSERLGMKARGRQSYWDVVYWVGDPGAIPGLQNLNGGNWAVHQQSPSDGR